MTGIKVCGFFFKGILGWIFKYTSSFGGIFQGNMHIGILPPWDDGKPSFGSRRLSLDEEDSLLSVGNHGIQLPHEIGSEESDVAEIAVWIEAVKICS
jgi:hypothetical protein